MTSRRSRFLTVIFSFLPGAGHMYMGFMKTGLSMMTVFFAVIFLSALFNIGIILYSLPIIWFYAFFDCINKMFLSDEEFAKEKDRYLLSLDSVAGVFSQIKYKPYLGVFLVIVGAVLLWNNLWPQFSPYFVEEARQIISSVSHILPQIIVSIAIIFIGAKLIMGRKKENGNV